MAFNWERLKNSQKRFLSKSLDRALLARAKNKVVQRHLELQQKRLKYLEERRERMERRDRIMVIANWRKSTERKTPAPQEWLSRQKSTIWREQARDRITKRGRRPGPIIPAMIFANDGTGHQLFFEKGEIRQKSTKANDTERKEFLNILPPSVFRDKSNRNIFSARVKKEHKIPDIDSLNISDSPPGSRDEERPNGGEEENEGTISKQNGETHVTFLDGLVDT